MSDINVLVACEESQRVCMAFRDVGCNAFSCDLQPCVRGFPQFHIHADVTPFLRGKNFFRLQSGDFGRVGRWHLIIAHPPCTYLCKVSSVWMVKNGAICHDRYMKMIKAREFFFKCLNAYAPFVAVENPLPMRRACLPAPSTFIDPSWFCEKYTKKTLLWLKNLPPLWPTLTNPYAKEFVRASRGKYRSRTFSGVARAMALQWSEYIINELNK